MSDIRFNNWKHQSGTGGVTQNAAGNVGIGSTLPTSALDIGGDTNITGVTTASNFKTGSSNLHSAGVEVAGVNVLGGNTPIGSGATIYDDGGARFSGIVSATSFVGDITGGGTFTGDISNATGAAAGLGTALSQTQTSPLNKIYFTDNILSIGATVTIDPPPSSTVAYTNYSDIKISGADLIIKDGDDFIPDILGLSTTSMRGRLTYN